MGTSKTVPQPKIVLGIPGVWKDRSEIVTAIASKSYGFLFAGMVIMDLATKQGFGLETYEHDPGLRKAFALAGAGQFDQKGLDAIDSHTFTLYPLGPGGSFDAAQAMVAVACGLLRAGGVAVKVESAGLAHTTDGWFKLAEKGDARSLYKAFVTLVGNDGNFYSCGMHNLGLRDAVVTGEIKPNAAARLLETFLLYRLLEKPKLKNGETFSIAVDAPYYRLKKERCETYSEKDLFHNPYGMWRLEPV
jgi:hypothetical protein